jgi:hypothetical protein
MFSKCCACSILIAALQIAIGFIVSQSILYPPWHAWQPHALGLPKGTLFELLLLLFFKYTFCNVIVVIAGSNNAKAWKIGSQTLYRNPFDDAGVDYENG